MPVTEFARLVTLACHDLRTPLATVNGFAKTLLRGGQLDDQSARFIALIDAAGEQLNDLLDLLGLAARIESGSYEPSLREVDTLQLVASDDERVVAHGEGVTAELDESALRRALHALAIAALRHGEVELVTWTVAGRELTLEPIAPSAASVVTGEEAKDLGALVARSVLERNGAELSRDGEVLRVRL
jgi:signal transduction histidine kinase